MKLGVVFVCENNQYAMTVRSSRVTAGSDLSLRAQAYGIPGVTVDGNDFWEVYRATAEAVRRAREGEGASLIVCDTFRLDAHATVFPASLHPAAKDEVETWRSRDPVSRVRAFLVSEGVLTESEEKAVRAQVRNEVDQAVQYALDAPWPDPSEATSSVFAPPYRPETKPPDAGGRELTYVAALSEALRQEMARDERVFCLGEDVELLGGLYGVTRGLAESFKGRVLDTAISENTFTGAGIGASVRGLRAVVELMYMDFTTLAMDQIVNLAAKLHYMTGGQVRVPVVIRTATGAGGSGSATHSQSLEAWFYHAPGVKVVMPSTPYDAKGLLITAVRDDNPVLFLEHKRLYQTKGPVPETAYAIPFGEAEVRRHGKDLTVIATGAMVAEALSAAAALKAELGLELEVIDPRTLVPLDLETILASVQKTRKAIVFNEAPRRGSVAADLAAQVGEAAFDWLDAPVLAVGMPHVPIPFSPVLEEQLIPNAETLVTEVRQLLGA